MRKYEVAYLAHSGDLDDFSRLAPAIPAFEDAFSALSRGGLIATTAGPVAIEDLWPGDMVLTEDHGPLPLIWKGSMTLVPGAPDQSADMGRLIRIDPDAFGFGKPAPDLVLGPRARLLHRSPSLRTIVSADTALVPARNFLDSVSVIDVLPQTPVRVFHLGFERHTVFRVNGLPVESYHPGPNLELSMGVEALQLFISLFPHLNTLTDFGPLAYPRVPENQDDESTAA